MHFIGSSLLPFYIIKLAIISIILYYLFGDIVRENELREISILLDDITELYGAFFLLQPMLSNPELAANLEIIRSDIYKKKYVEAVNNYNKLIFKYYKKIGMIELDDCFRFS